MRNFTFQFEEEQANSFTYECSVAEDERLDCSVEAGVPSIYLNQSAMLTLAKLLIKVAHGEYEDGFHVHLHRDFNGDLPECLTVILNSAKTGDPL